MKSITSLIAVMILVIAVSAFAVGPAPLSTNKVAIQNIMPEPTKSATLTIPKGSAKTVTINTRGLSSISWLADDGAGTPVVVKRSFNANTADMPKSSENWLKIHQNTSSVKFTGYSSGADRFIHYDAE